MTPPAIGATVVIVGDTAYAGRIGRVVAAYPGPGTVMVALPDDDRPTARDVVLPFGASETIVTIPAPQGLTSGSGKAIVPS